MQLFIECLSTYNSHHIYNFDSYDNEHSVYEHFYLDVLIIFYVHKYTYLSICARARARVSVLCISIIAIMCGKYKNKLKEACGILYTIHT